METGPVELDQLQADQRVYSSDDQDLGHVAGITVDRDTGESYLKVAAGLFGMLYVPKSAIEYAVLGQPVRLNVPDKDAKKRFSERPNVY
jgi:hypothetical protein